MVRYEAKDLQAFWPQLYSATVFRGSSDARRSRLVTQDLIPSPSPYWRLPHEIHSYRVQADDLIVASGTLSLRRFGP